MKDIFISLNGECIPTESFGISPSNRAFRYGDGVFETIRVVDGKVLWYDRHYQRLRRSASILQMILPVRFGPDLMREHILDLYRKNHPAGGAARVRFSLFRNDGGYYTPISNRSSFIIDSEALPDSSYKLNEEGLRVDIFPEFGKPLGVMSGLKTSSALMFVMASLYKTRENLDDCLILNHHGGIAEATSSNIFMLKDGVLMTPGLDQDCVDGIMRSVLLDIARKNGMDVKESPLMLGHLEQADELFLSNTISGISWVRRFRHVTYKHDTAVRLLEMLHEACRKET
jgi:aminodeoxychorismate lyase